MLTGFEPPVPACWDAMPASVGLKCAASEVADASGIEAASCETAKIAADSNARRLQRQRQAGHRIRNDLIQLHGCPPLTQWGEPLPTRTFAVP